MMSVNEVGREAREEILQRDILPLYFPPAPVEDSPAFVLLTGQPGAGRLRAVLPAGLGGMAVVNAEELQAFHPEYARLRGARVPEALDELARTAASWVSGCTRHARESGRSVVLDGVFPDSVVAAAAVERFEAAGFSTRVVFVASRRVESLLTVASTYLQDVRSRHLGGVVTRESHDAGLAATRRLAASLDEAAWADRVTVVSRGGRVILDEQRDPAGSSYAGVGAVLEAAQSERMSRWDATQWLSELHHVTDYAMSLRAMPDGVAELLVDLHASALREVIPELHIPTDGKFRSAIEERTRVRLGDLRTVLQPRQTADAAAPIVAPDAAELGGVSR